MNSSLTFNKELLLALAGLAILIAIPLIFPSRVALDFVIRLTAFGLFATSLNILVGYGGMVSFGHAMFFGGGVVSDLVSIAFCKDFAIRQHVDMLGNPENDFHIVLDQYNGESAFFPQVVNRFNHLLALFGSHAGDGFIEQ